MKTIYTVAFVLFISASLSFTSKTVVKENTLTATFKEVTEEDYYKFIDNNKKEILFYDINEEIEISLYEDEFIGKKFSITWVEKEIEITDDEGELTGEKKKVKSITKLKLIE
ncbi:hypothetical protein MC378_09835 [Polaribacter sp. MSW13]|uniref:Uncharacterized protein n=1 Tax=Polaribacter marinus TaxID=2916838 RepID=A0A9X2AJF1_9FLAO|nr:hypothetical protein [Polaribacter marinus]MCI2229466.1 hypothetical protein [Polaribacter marinus]